MRECTPEELSQYYAQPRTKSRRTVTEFDGLSEYTDGCSRVDIPDYRNQEPSYTEKTNDSDLFHTLKSLKDDEAYTIVFKIALKG